MDCNHLERPGREVKIQFKIASWLVFFLCSIGQKKEIAGTMNKEVKNIEFQLGVGSEQ